MRRVACTSTAATDSCGLCCRDSGPVGGDVCRWFSPTRSSVGTAELSPAMGLGNRAAFVVLWQERRRVVHFGVTEHPTEEWTMQQMREAFPWDQAPRYVLRDREAIYGRDFDALTRDMGMQEVLTAARSPWQNPFVEGWWAPSDASAWTTL